MIQHLHEVVQRLFILPQTVAEQAHFIESNAFAAQVGAPPVAGAIVADGVDVTLVLGARLLVFAGESQLAAVGPPGEILCRP